MRISELLEGIHKISEVFDTGIPRDSKVKITNNSYLASARIGNRKIQFLADSSFRKGEWDVVFKEIDVKGNNALDTKRIVKNRMTGASRPYAKTGSGYEFQVFSFILYCMRDFAAKFRPQIITFSAAETNRSSLYERMLKRFARDASYKFDQYQIPVLGQNVFMFNLRKIEKYGNEDVDDEDANIISEETQQKNNEQIELDERKKLRKSTKKKTNRYFYGPAYYGGYYGTGEGSGDGGGGE